MFIGFMIMRLRERRLPQSTDAAGLQGSEGLDGFLEAVQREGSKARTPEGKGGTVPSTGTTCRRLLEAASVVQPRRRPGAAKVSHHTAPTRVHAARAASAHLLLIPRGKPNGRAHPSATAGVRSTASKGK